MPKAAAFLEDLLAPKRGLGAEYKFKLGMLEVKPNRHGIGGVFTRQAVGTGTEIISVPVINGSMTPFRAYEEAEELLSTLGPSRFNISQEFAIAAAIYLRSGDPDGAASDVLITEPDLASAYAGSPMTSYDSLARAKLLNSNNGEALEYAAELDRQIEQLGVNPELFRAILGYISSRAWKGVGVIPVLDWFNASYADGANCTFQMKDGRFCYVAIKDVAAGEELLWNYNNANAVTTWLNYGYLDVERPTLAFLEIRIEEAQRAALETLAHRELNLAPNTGSSHTKVDSCVFQRELLTPGLMVDDAHARRTVGTCMKSFASARAWFRMFVLSGEDQTLAPISYASINADEPVFGAEVEARVLATMRAALATGRERLRARVEVFSNSPVGRNVGMTPYVDMAEDAHRTWAEALAIAERICTTGNLDNCATTIRAALGLPVAGDPHSLLEEIETRPASLVASMVKRYAKALG